MAPVRFARRCSLVLAGLAVASLTLTACTGVHAPRDDGPSTVRYRYDAEVIPDARLVRIETTPRWPLGSYGYEPGVDRLLVISRTTTVTEAVDPGGAEPIVKVPVDRFFERVWITLPLNTQIGEKITLADLEARFMVGYDDAIVGDQQFIQPNRFFGVVQVLEDHDDTLVLELRMSVELDRKPRWEMGRTLTVPIRTEPLIATTAPTDRIVVEDNVPTLSAAQARRSAVLLRRARQGRTPMAPGPDEVDALEIPLTAMEREHPEITVPGSMWQ